MLGYNLRTLVIVSVTLSVICGMIEFLGTYNYSHMAQHIRARKTEENEVIDHHLSVELHPTTTAIQGRRYNIELDLMPIPELDGKCEIDVVDIARLSETSTSNSTSDAMANFDVNYWFAIGTTANKIDDLTLFRLHQYIYTAIDESNIWCTSGIAAVDNNNTAVSRLGVITFIPTTLVPSKNLFCQTQAFNNTSSETTNATKSVNCFVMQGTMQILAQTASTATLATYAMHKELRNVMSLAASEDSPILDDVTILSYLGNTVEDAVIFLASLVNKIDPPVGSIEQVTNESPSENKSPVAFVFVVGVPLLLALFLSMYVVRRRSLLKAGMNTIQSWEEYDPTTNVLRGTGDPPDSYHDGLYHYMNHGRQKYLSTRCTLCLETKRNITGGLYASALHCSTSTLGNRLTTHLRNNNEDNDDNDEAYQMSRARSDMKLGHHHMGMDVHVCQSATCLRCMANVAPMFVPTGIVRHPKNKAVLDQQNSTNGIEDDNSSLSSSETPTSRNNSADDNQSFETKSIYNRDEYNTTPVSRTSLGGRLRWYNK